VAFGLALQNSPLAIVLYFVLPTALSVIAGSCNGCRIRCVGSTST
jgi:hypothetical protein